MSLLNLIRKNKSTITTNVDSTNYQEGRKETVAKIATVAIANPTNQKTSSDIEMIRQWLFKIEEPEEYHHIVLDKCKNDPEALTYFLKHVNGEF